MSSTRLPNKPMADINGKPMIVWVWEKAIKSNLGEVIVACDHQDIVDTVEKVGGKAILTDSSLPSGSDRIWQSLLKIDNYKEFDVIINLQGDLPTIEPKLIKEILIPIKNGFDIATLASKITDKREIENPNIVKIAMSEKIDSVRKAFYFSRCAIPHNAKKHFHHIGIYAYKKEALKKFIESSPSELEKYEKLEQLRALELGLNIGVLEVETIPLGVDTKEDLDKARSLLKS